MTTVKIEDIRAQYPQYDDMSDVDLASALHQRFYSDLPRAQVFRALGVETVDANTQPRPRPNLLGESPTAIDGDTVQTLAGSMRLTGIDAPELAQTGNRDGGEWPAGEWSQDMLSRLMEANPGAEPQISGEDRYGRLLGALMTPTDDLNARMVAAGAAIPYMGEQYGDEQTAAQHARLGLWSGTFETPSSFRRGDGDVVEASEAPQGLSARTVSYDSRTMQRARQSLEYLASELETAPQDQRAQIEHDMARLREEIGALEARTMQPEYAEGVLRHVRANAPAPAALGREDEGDPFAGEGIAPLLARRGQQFARGATEAVAALPEAVAIHQSRSGVRQADVADHRLATLSQFEQELTQLDDRTAQIEVALGINGNPRPSRENRLNSEQRSALEAEYAEIAARRGQISSLVGSDGFSAERRAATETLQSADTRPAHEREVFGVGDTIRDASGEFFGEPDPRDTSFWASVAEGGGNMAAMAASSLAAGAVSGGTGALLVGGAHGSGLNSSQVYREAIEAGADEETAQRAAGWASVVGASEIVPINRALRLLPPRMRGQITNGFMRRFADIAQSAGEEAAQEYVATVANNLIAQNLYDPDRGWTDGATESALVGGVLGGGMGAIGTALNRRNTPIAPPERGQEDEAEPPEVTQVPPAPTAPAARNALDTPRSPEPPAVPQPPAPAPPVATDPLTASMEASPSREVAAPDVAQAMSPQPAQGERYETMDEVETIDGESVPTGRQVRVNLDTGEVSPVDPDSAPEQREAVQSQPQVPDVGTDDAPAAGEAVFDEVEDAGSPEANSAGDAAISSIHTETLPSEAVAQIETDATTFQYKDHGDEDGVTERLQGITDWDERSAMGGIIFEYADGRRVVADGHQRLGLARRLQRTGVRTPWNVEIIREADGFTPADVRRIAALKNIREGSGTAIDAAKVLREAPGDIDSLNLPPRSSLVRDAKGLARLSDDAFGMVVNEVVRPEWGAAVGANVADQALHADVVSLLKKLQPKNNAQAAMIAQQAGQEAVTETQTSLFGDEQVAESLYLERAKVLDAALKRLKQDRATFKVLSDRANTITEAGNVLNSDANAQRVEADSKAAAYLTAEANRKGPISDALTAASRDLKANPRQSARVVREFLEALRTPTGAEPSGTGSDRGRANPQTKPRQESVKHHQSETTDAGEQSLIPGVEPVNNRERAEADMQKPMSGRDNGPGSGRDDLFGNPEDRRDLFDEAPSADDKNTVGTFVDRATEADDTIFKDRSADLPARIPAAKLATEAKRLTLEPGRKDGVEYLMLIDGEGQIVAYGSGHETGTGLPGAMHLLANENESLVAHHNHPSSNGFSPSDLTFALMPGAKVIYAHGHDGSTFAVRSTTLGRSMWPEHKQQNQRFQQIMRDLTNASDNIWRKSYRAINRLVEDGTYPAEPDNGKQTGTYLQPGRDRSFAFMLALEQAGIVEIDVSGPAAARFKADVNPYLLDPELKKLYENLVRTLRRRAKNADTEGKYDRPTDARRHPGELERSLEASATDQARHPDDGSRNQAGARRDPREGSQSSVDDADFLGALDDVFGADTDQARDGPTQIAEPPKKRAKADIAKDMQAVLRGMKEDAQSVDDGKFNQLAPLFAEALDGIDPTTQSRRETFGAMMRPLVDAGLTREDVQALQPYFARFLDDVEAGKIELKGDANASGTSSDLEPDRGDTDIGDGVGGADVPATAGTDGPRVDQGGRATDAEGGQRQGRGRVSDGNATPMGTQSDQGISRQERDGGQPADDRDGAGSRNRGEQGLPADPGRAEDTAQYASDAPDVVDRKATQAEADAARVIPGDRTNIDKTLPLLLPEQRDDVWKVEQRFEKTDKDGNPIGHGMLLTNGTGTGKTYSGGGVIKRFAQQGKDNILILAPSQGILDAWVDMGADMGLDISKLDDTTSAGTGIVATTYANAGENVELAKRDWDLVVTDESQKLSQNAAGDQTSALRTVRAITNRPENLLDKARMLLAKEWAKVEAMPEGSEQRNAAQRATWEQTSAKAKDLVGKERSKVLFLSATPFAYDKNVDYAEGYLFQYGADGVTESGSRQDGRNLFFVENFGYRIRYHKLTKPEAAVDNGVFEREFHERLKREGVLSGRSLDIAADYDRKFVKISSADGEKIDAAMRLISDKSDNTPTGRKWRELGDHVRRNFTYLRRLQLLEAIKAEASVSDIQAHLDMGRKVVVFHDYNKGGGFNPFMGRDVVIPTADAMEGYKLLLQEMPEVADLNFSGLGSPIETLTAAFGNRTRVYNGTVSQKERAAAKSEFNRDGSGVDVIIVQSAAGEAGISLHDTTGGHQRALINLGMPVRPTTTLQEEGRIRRVGSVSDAVFRYYTTGTAWERQAFAGKIAENSGTVENLALGNEARAIREAFISSYMDAGDYKPSLEDGKGGRDADRSTATTSPFDQAKTHYFARTKNNQKRDRRAGVDFYATPEPLGFKMAEWAKVRTYEKVLEPSAGDGAIARYFPGDADRTIIEPSMDLITKAQLRAPGSKVIQEQFEDHYIGNKYDAVVMNPPFGSGGKTAMEHMTKAARHLRAGGRLVALVPTGPAADKQLAKQMTEGEPLADLQWTADIALPAVTFEKAGTSVAARVVIFDKFGKDTDENHQTKRINMRGAQSIADFFERLEDIDVPERPAVTERAGEVEGVVRPGPVQSGDKFDVFEFQNTKTGETMFGAQIKEDLGDRFKEVAGIAKSHGGYYSRYQNKAAGARRGFLFKTDADRSSFIEDLGKPRFGLEETSTEFPADPRANPAFRRWFGDSKVVDESGAPLVLWHGTALRKYTPEWDSFKGMTWGARDSGLAIDYANARAAMSKGGEYYARLHELFMRIERPFNADLGVPRTVQIDDITNALIEQAEAYGRPLDDAKGRRMAELIETLQAARIREESGPSYSRHDFWNDTTSLFGRDGSDAIAEMFELLGFDGVTMIENGTETWGAFRPDQVKGRYNRGTFDIETDKFMERRGQTTADTIAPAMPSLRAELDRLNLKRVKLRQDNSGQRLGAFRADTDGALEILIGPSLDPEATLYHESIHAMRTLNLFSPQEWRAMEIKAAKTWVEQYDIAKRYPDLLPSEQIEEAIAEAFADAAKTHTAPKGSILVQAFNKIARLLKALGNSLRGAGFQTAEDVFGRAMAGEIGARDTGSTGFVATIERDSRSVEGWRRQLTAFLSNTKRTPPELSLGAVPAALRAVGVPRGPVIIGGFKLRKIIEEHPAARRAIIDLPQLIADPDAIIKQNRDDSDFRIVTSARSQNGFPIVANIKVQGTTRHGQPARVVMTIYDWSGAEGAITNAARSGHLVYLKDENAAVSLGLKGDAPLSASNAKVTDRAPRKILTRADIVNSITKEARAPTRKRQTAQQRAHSATAMSANGGFAYIPDRRIWEELSASGAGIWKRLRGGAAAANDWADKARIKIQDRFLPVLRAQEAIIRTTGQPISEEQNAYLAEETFSGKVGRHLFEIDEDFTKRIIDIMAGNKREAMLDTEYVGNWLYARHAQERNARIASINPNMHDGGSGMTNAESAQILADAASSPNASRLQEIGDLIDELRERALKLREDAGLITPDEADLWRNQYKHYVPLKGFADTDHSEAMLDVTGMGRRFNTRGAETKRALGRRSEAFNPLQGAITQAQEVAIRAEKNRVGQALYKLAKDFPSPDLWSVKTPAQKRFYNRTTGLVETRVEDPVSLFLEPNELAVKINGQERRILFHDNRLAQAAGTVGADQMNWFIGLMSKASRWFSSVNTMLDPEFVIRNAFRDMTAAQINIRNFGESDRNAMAKAMIKNWPKAWRAAYRGQLNKTDTEWDKYYREFDQVGAKVSFWKLEQPDAEMQDLERRVKMAGGNLGQRASRFLRISTRDNPVLGFIERVNLSVDNAVRLAAYVEARKKGWSKSDAASLSKNLTVNFNRRGEWGASINALYPFANAGIQGTQILFRAMTSKRMAKYALGMVALGFILDQVNASMSEEDEDGELAYDKIPEWKRQLNLVVMLGPDSGNAATVWLPYGYNLFPYLGQQLSRISRGVQEPGDAMVDFAGALFGSFSPLGGRDVQSVITPTMLDPINEMAMNQDWLGRPIRPENPYSDYGPDAYKFFGGASIASREIADALNRATGGSIAESGFIDVSPEYIDHAFGFAAGGAGRFWGRTTDTLGKLLRGEVDDIEARNIPFYRSLQYETGDWLDRDRYYRFREHVREARDAMRTYQGSGMPVPEHVRRVAGLYDTSRETERVLREMRSATRRLEAREDLSAAQISERRAAIDERAANVYLRFNQVFVRVNGPQGD